MNSSRTFRRLSLLDFYKVVSFVQHQSKSLPVGHFASTDPKVIATCLQDQQGISHAVFGEDGTILATKLTYKPGEQFAHFNIDYDERLLFSAEDYQRLWRSYGTIVEPSLRYQRVGAELLARNVADVFVEEPKGIVTAATHVENHSMLALLARYCWEKKCSVVCKSDLAPAFIFTKELKE